MRQQSRPLDVPQKLGPEPVTQVRAFDQPGNVGHHERPILETHHAQIRFQGREGVIGDLRPRRRNPRYQSRFAGVREADQTHIGQELQLEPQPEIVAWPSGFVLRWSLVSRRRESRISSTAATALGHHESFTRSCEIVQQFASLGVVDDRPHRHRQLDGVTLATSSVRAFAVPAPFGLVFRIEPEMQQRVVVLACYHHYVSAPSAVAAARPPARNVFLTTERETAVAAIACFNLNDYFVDEHWRALGPIPAQSSENEKPAGSGCAARTAGSFRKSRLAGGSGFLLRLNAHELAHPAAIPERHDPRNFGEERIVFADAYVLAGLDLGAALANDDRAAGNQLTCKYLYAEPLRIRVAAVLGTT